VKIIIAINTKIHYKILLYILPKGVIKEETFQNKHKV